MASPPGELVVRIAFIGNSVLYYNDTPRLLEALAAPQRAIEHGACVRGGASLSSLWKQGGGSSGGSSALQSAPSVKALLSARWAFAVLNDYTQGPARAETRDASVEALTKRYAPLLEAAGATPVVLQTWAYRACAKGSDDLGDAAAFTARLREGTAVYATALARVLPTRLCPRVAPVGDAFLVVHDERPELWHNLFQADDYHPSPSGSFLQACVLHCTLFGIAPEEHVACTEDANAIWSRARIMEPHDQPPLPRSTAQERAYLLRVAQRVCAGSTNGAAAS